jgi:hypothetical protein
MTIWPFSVNVAADITAFHVSSDSVSIHAAYQVS